MEVENAASARGDSARHVLGLAAGLEVSLSLMSTSSRAGESELCAGPARLGRCHLSCRLQVHVLPAPWAAIVASRLDTGSRTLVQWRLRCRTHWQQISSVAAGSTWPKGQSATPISNFFKAVKVSRIFQDRKQHQALPVASPQYLRGK